MDVVRLTVVAAPEAEVLCGLLRATGVECAHRPARADGELDDYREVVVAAADAAAARALLAELDAVEY